LEPDLGQFTSTDDLLASYKEIQAAFTRVSQENKSLKDQTVDSGAMDQLKSELEDAKLQLEARQVQPNLNQPKNFDESWMDSPEATIDQRVAVQLQAARIDDALNAQKFENPEEYQERYAYADILAKDPKYAGLAQTPEGINQLFKVADKMRAGNLEKSLRKSFELLNDGEPLDDEQLANAKKVLFGKKSKQSNNDAYMPDGSTSTKSAADSEAGRNSNAKIDAAVEKGDVDGVLDAIMDDIRA
jgi:hypothetical protein